MIFAIIKYALAILLPVVIIAFEKNKIPYVEIVDIIKAKIFLKLGDNKIIEDNYCPIINCNEYFDDILSMFDIIRKSIKCLMLF